MRKTIISLTLALILVLTLSNVSALIVSSVDTPVLNPGESGILSIEIQNNFGDDVKEVTLNLNFENTHFISTSGSSESTDEIDSDDEEEFTFRIKASNDIKPGDYSIPYTIQFKINGDSESKTGTIGISISGITKLAYTIDTQSPVLNQQGKITLRIINKEFGDARFVSVKIFPDGYSLLSDDEIYIGNVDSDDFETATFDVLFNSRSPRFIALVEYKDFDNKNLVENIDLPFKVFSREEALQLGLIQRNNTGIYITLAITLILAYILYRVLKKRARLKKSQEENNKRGK
jgi:hypothetical protein